MTIQAAQQFRRAFCLTMILLSKSASRSGEKTEKLVRGPRETINAAMLAAAIRVQAGIETDVRAVVVGDGGLAVIHQKLRAWQDVVIRVPVRVRFKMNFLKPVRRIFSARRDGAESKRSSRMMSPFTTAVKSVK